MGDEDNPQEERLDSVCEILSGAAEEGLDEAGLDAFRRTLEERWDERVGLEKEKKEAAKAAKLKKMDNTKEEERRQVEEADRERKAKAEKIVKRSAEEQAERARLLGEYGYDSDPLDEDGNPLPPEEGGEGEGAAAKDTLGDAYGKNLNKEVVRQELAAKRDAIKKNHQTTTLQNKIALEADKMRKELAKNARKTQKGERRSGRG
ncbi:unnamed protein product [Laminaria digitata]